MSGTILVNHATLGLASVRLQEAGVSLGDDAKTLQQANDNLLANWQGSGSAAFSVASASAQGFLVASSAILFSESLSLSGADTGFADQDTILAAGLGSTGQ